MIRSTGFPFTLSSGKYTRCVRGSTDTVCACGMTMLPSWCSVIPFAPDRSVNTATVPDSDETYNRCHTASKANTSGSSPTGSVESTFIVERSTTASLAFPSPATNATRCAGARTDTLGAWQSRSDAVDVLDGERRGQRPSDGAAVRKAKRRSRIVGIAGVPHRVQIIADHRRPMEAQVEVGAVERGLVLRKSDEVHARRERVFHPGAGLHGHEAAGR